MMTTENLKSTLSVFMELIWNNGDFRQIEKYVALAYEIKHDPGDPWEGQVLGIERFKERVLYSRNAFPDLRFDIQEMIAEKDRVVSSWIMSGTHSGDLPQLPATGRTFSITGMTIYYFAAGKVCGHWQAYDRLGFLGQIGFLG
jgi:steroid delta-isomerase-like uncharacterized protein